jgi:hypothetical protein
MREKSVIDWHRLSMEAYQNSLSLFFGAASKNINGLFFNREQRRGYTLGLHDGFWHAI